MPLLLDLYQVFQLVPTTMWSFQSLEGLKAVTFCISQNKNILRKRQLSSPTVLHTNSTKVNSTLLPFRLDDSTDIIKNCEWLLSTWNKVKRIEEPLQKERANAHIHMNLSVFSASKTTVVTTSKSIDHLQLPPTN